MGNQQQQSLARRRASPAACRAGASGSDRFTSFVLNITLWRLLSLAGLPLRQIVSWYVFTGRSCWALVVDLQRWLWRAVGWLSAPPRTAALQRFGSPLLDVRRWHYGLGESLPPTSLSNAFYLAAQQSQRLLCSMPCHRGSPVLRTWSSSGVIGGCRVSTCPAQRGCSKAAAISQLDDNTYACVGPCGRRMQKSIWSAGRLCLAPFHRRHCHLDLAPCSPARDQTIQSRLGLRLVWACIRHAGVEVEHDVCGTPPTAFVSSQHRRLVH